MFVLSSLQESMLHRHHRVFISIFLRGTPDGVFHVIAHAWVPPVKLSVSNFSLFVLNKLYRSAVAAVVWHQRGIWAVVALVSSDVTILVT